MMKGMELGSIFSMMGGPKKVIKMLTSNLHRLEPEIIRFVSRDEHTFPENNFACLVLSPVEVGEDEKRLLIYEARAKMEDRDLLLEVLEDKKYTLQQFVDLLLAGAPQNTNLNTDNNQDNKEDGITSNQ